MRSSLSVSADRSICSRHAEQPGEDLAGVFAEVGAEAADRQRLVAEHRHDAGEADVRGSASPVSTSKYWIMSRAAYCASAQMSAAV